MNGIPNAFSAEEWKISYRKIPFRVDFPNEIIESKD